MAVTKIYHKVLTIAGSDSSGGAGIQGDLKTISALGCYGMSVITALTAQNTVGITSIHMVPEAFVQEQLEAIFCDIGADAVKIGMLYSAEITEIVSRQLIKHNAKNIVLDPLMVAQSGEELLQDNALRVIKEQLMPMASVLTPNLPEASILLNTQVLNLEDMHNAARELARFGSKAILIKGGHLGNNNSNDLLYICPEDRFILLKAKRIATLNNHGTGCALSSAIASFLAKGFPVEKAVRLAKDYIDGAIRAGAVYKYGNGHGPLHHYYKFW